jgi:predicted transposase YbfD/YdcC
MDGVSTVETQPDLALTEHFASLEDPRVDRTKLHPLLSVVTIAICAVISGAHSWNDIEEFGEAAEGFFADFLELPGGIPSHDTFNRVFAALDPSQFRECFAAWMRSVAGVLPAQVVALDGKTVRRSHARGAGRGPIHVVSAWATQNRLVLANLKVDEKTNEITAIPELLRGLAIRGCIVTIDAMGCQREIAEQIVDQGGDYVLALKGNQGSLQEDVVDSFKEAEASSFGGIGHDHAETLNKGHGRIERRGAWVINDEEVIDWINSHHKWPGLRAVGMIRSERRIGEKVETESRYYILSKSLPAAQFAQAVRSHWGIENSVHWVLDTAFREDESRVRAGYAAENLATLRHMALNLLKKYPSKKGSSIRTRRLRAGWDTNYLRRLLSDEAQ